MAASGDARETYDSGHRRWSLGTYPQMHRHAAVLTRMACLIASSSWAAPPGNGGRRSLRSRTRLEKVEGGGRVWLAGLNCSVEILKSDLTGNAGEESSPLRLADGRREGPGPTGAHVVRERVQPVTVRQGADAGLCCGRGEGGDVREHVVPGRRPGSDASCPLRRRQ